MPPHVDDETTLAHHLITGIDSLIEGKVPAASMRLYSTQDHTTPSYTRDTSCWANDSNYFGMSPGFYYRLVEIATNSH